MAQNNTYNSYFTMTLKGVSIHRESFTADEVSIAGNLDTDAEKLYELLNRFIDITEKQHNSNLGFNKTVDNADIDWVQVGCHGINRMGVVNFCDTIYYLRYEDRDTNPNTSYLMVDGRGDVLSNLRNLFSRDADEVITNCEVLHVERINRRYNLVSFIMEVKGKPVLVDGACLKALVCASNGGPITRKVLETVLG